MWCIPPRSNADFVCKMEDVLDVYKRPYDIKRPMVCMDETSKQLVGEVRKPIAVVPGKPAKYDNEYIRNGVANIFMFCEPLAGKRHVIVTDRRTKMDWSLCVRELVDKVYPNAERIVLVHDNLNTHKLSSLYDAFHPKVAKRIADRLEIHYTPKHGSWLNMAEIELSIISRQCLNQRIGNKEKLTSEISSWEKEKNQTNSKIDWQFTTKDARIKLRKLYPSIEVR